MVKAIEASKQIVQTEPSSEAGITGCWEKQIIDSGRLGQITFVQLLVSARDGRQVPAAFQSINWIGSAARLSPGSTLPTGALLSVASLLDFGGGCRPTS